MFFQRFLSRGCNNTQGSIAHSQRYVDGWKKTSLEGKKTAEVTWWVMNHLALIQLCMCMFFAIVYAHRLVHCTTIGRIHFFSFTNSHTNFLLFHSHSFDAVPDCVRADPIFPFILWTIFGFNFPCSALLFLRARWWHSICLVQCDRSENNAFFLIRSHNSGKNTIRFIQMRWFPFLQHSVCNRAYSVSTIVIVNNRETFSIAANKWWPNSIEIGTESRRKSWKRVSFIVLQSIARNWHANDVIQQIGKLIDTYKLIVNCNWKKACWNGCNKMMEAGWCCYFLFILIIDIIIVVCSERHARMHRDYETRRHFL